MVPDGQKILSDLADSVFRFLAQDDTRLPTGLTTAALYTRAALQYRSPGERLAEQLTGIGHPGAGGRVMR